jgi:thiol-disulfide isomerase/thioredoxin
MTRHLLAILLALAVLAAACGDSDEATTTSAPVTTASGNTLETLPPTSTEPPPTTIPPTTVDLVAAQYGAPEIIGDPLPPVGGTPDPAAGLASPVIVGADYYGNRASIGDTGTTQAVLFVAHWCGHCQNELPEIVSWLDETGGVDGVNFLLVTVAVDPNRPNFPPSEWIEREGWAEPILLDDDASSAFQMFGGSAIPYWVFLNPDGTVATRVEGGIGSDELAAILADLSIAP